MRIYLRLLAMIGVSALIISVLSAIAFLGLRSQGNALDRIYKRDVANLQAAADVDRLALEINCRAYKISNLALAGGDKTALQKEVTGIDGDFLKLETQVGSLASAFNVSAESSGDSAAAQISASIKVIIEKTAAYKAAVKNALNVIKDGDSDVVAMIMLGSQSHFNQLIAEQAKLVALVQAGSDRSFATAANAHALTLRYFIAAIVIGLVALISASLYNARAIARPLRAAVKTLSAGAVQTTAAAGKVSAASQQLAEGAGLQAASIQESSASLEEFAATTQHNAQNVQEVSELSKQARQAAEHGAADMQLMAAAMAPVTTFQKLSGRSTRSPFRRTYWL